MSDPGSVKPAQADLAFIVDVARRAGEQLLELFEDAQGLAIDRLEVELKGRRDLVTNADLRSERLILDSIRSRFPNDATLAEESGAEGLERSDRVWIVDPLDGTTNYAHGHPMFSVSIALWSRETPLLAVVHAPRLGETYWAAAGQGAYRNGAPIRVANCESLGDALLATGFSYERREIAAGAMATFEKLLLESREIRRCGSACLDLAHTAAGVFAGFWEYHLHAHDIAAGALLVTEAGGVVSDVSGGRDFLFGGSLVAGAPTIHTALLEALRTGPPHPGR